MNFQDRTEHLGPFFLGGPTGVGKSEVAAELATRINGEIVGADAFQVYSELPLLTAQPELPLQLRIPHHMVNCVGVEESYNVERYRKEACQRIQEILQRGKVPIVVGGTGLYFRSLIQGLDPLPDSDPFLRQELQYYSLAALQERLAKVDPNAREHIDIRNPRRVLRAIEICEVSGRPLRDFYSKKAPISSFYGWTLFREREDLNHRIVANVARMWERGVVSEVEKIWQRVGMTAAQAIGFREILALLKGDMTETQCQEAIVQATRQYSKRQLTWFRHQTTFSPLNLSTLPIQTFYDSLPRNAGLVSSIH